MFFQPFLLTILLIIHLSSQLTNGIVVDGHKRKELSATRNQSHEEEMLDTFNDRTCGINDPNLEEHEFVNMAREGQFPWIVSFQLTVPINFKVSNKNSKTEIKVDKKLKKKTDDKGKVIEKDVHFCSGSFIADKWILTAAHCFNLEKMKTYLHDNKLKVVAGSHKVSSRCSLNRNLTISKIYIHKSFVKKTPIGFDIGLVELKDKVEFSKKRIKSPLNEQTEPFANSICLPKSNKKFKFNETARIAGWGLSEEKDETSMPSKLLTTDILLSDTEKCSNDYAKEMGSDLPRKQFKKYNDFICASLNNTRDSCQSDSGGPLMQFADGRAVVIGIVSYGIGCASKLPGLYTKTSAYINWIKEIVKYGSDSNVAFNLIENDAEQVVNEDEANSKTSPRPGTDQSTATTESPSETTSTTTTTTKPSEDDEQSAEKFKFFDD